MLQCKGITNFLWTLYKIFSKFILIPYFQLSILVSGAYLTFNIHIIWKCHASPNRLYLVLGAGIPIYILTTYWGKATKSIQCVYLICYKKKSSSASIRVGSPINTDANLATNILHVILMLRSCNHKSDKYLQSILGISL